MTTITFCTCLVFLFVLISSGADSKPLNGDLQEEIEIAEDEAMVSDVKALANGVTKKEGRSEIRSMKIYIVISSKHLFQYMFCAKVSIITV